MWSSSQSRYAEALLHAIRTEIAFSHDGLLASKVGKKASTNLAASQFCMHST